MLPDNFEITPLNTSPDIKHNRFEDGQSETEEEKKQEKSETTNFKKENKSPGKFKYIIEETVLNEYVDTISLDRVSEDLTDSNKIETVVDSNIINSKAATDILVNPVRNITANEEQDELYYKSDTSGVYRRKFIKEEVYSMETSSKGDYIQEEYEVKIKTTEYLLKWNEMPEHLQFNPYIKTGYRPMLSVWGCISSLFYIHNETFNIITHGMPIVYIILKIPSITQWSAFELQILSWCHIIGITSPWIGSFIYHLFMNLDRDEQFYQRLLQLDMLGIWICQSIGAMPMVFTFTHCFDELSKWCCISLYCAVALWGLHKAMLAISPWERRLCFLLPFTLRILLCVFRFFNFGGGDPNALTHLLLQDFIAVIGAVIGALHIPEKWFPGLVDKCWNSHNLMHILVLAAVYSMHEATMQDLRWVDQIQCNS